MALWKYNEKFWWLMQHFNWNRRLSENEIISAGWKINIARPFVCNQKTSDFFKKKTASLAKTCELKMKTIIVRKIFFATHRDDCTNFRLRLILNRWYAETFLCLIISRAMLNDLSNSYFLCQALTRFKRHLHISFKVDSIFSFFGGF